MRKRALLISGVPSPFQIELAEAVSNYDDDWDMDVWFLNKLPPHRGQHWLSAVDSKCAHFLHDPSGGNSISLSEHLNSKNYSIIVCGLPIHPNTLKIMEPVLDLGIPTVLWNEQPLPRNRLFTLIKKIVYRSVINRLNPVALFAIGDRAVAHYRKVFDRNVYLVPYFQDLSYTTNEEKVFLPTNKVRFLFSGRLIARNNIENILSAVVLLANKGLGEKFEVSFYGDGDLKSKVRAAAHSLPETIKINSFVAESWIDRLKPIQNCDVLLSPGIYSGWGLTIPEALSMGVPVISTPGIESARYFIRDGLNGLMCGASPVEIADAMMFFIEQPNNIPIMSLYCKESSIDGDVRLGRRALTMFFSSLTRSC